MGDCLGAERQLVLINGLTDPPRQNILEGCLLPLRPFSAAPLHLGTSHRAAHRGDSLDGDGPWPCSVIRRAQLGGWAPPSSKATLANPAAVQNCT